jgi:zinc transport system permease protein
MDLLEIFTTSFMQRALITGVLLAILLGFFGIFIVPRRMGFMADGVAHGSLLGVAIGLFLGAYPIIFAMVTAAACGIILARISSNSRITHDGLIGLFLTGGMSGAIILMTFMPGYKPELFSYLFGNILAIQWTDVYVLITAFSVTAILLRRQWRPLVMTTIHSDLSRIIRIPVTTSRYFLFVGTSIALIAGVKLLGVILVSALLIIPVLIANQLGSSFKSTVVISQFSGTLCTFGGIIISYIFDIPTGPTIALTLVTIFTISASYSAIQTKLIKRHSLLNKGRVT